MQEQTYSEIPESIPHLSVIKMTQGFNGFISKIGPIVDAWDFIFGIFTLRDPW